MFKPGDVIFAAISDPQGGNIKNRPAVVLMEATDGNLFLVVAGTTKYERGRPEADQIELPFGNERSPCQTGLDEATAVCLWWQLVIHGSEVNKKVGAVPTRLSTAIMNGAAARYGRDESVQSRVRQSHAEAKDRHGT